MAADTLCFTFLLCELGKLWNLLLLVLNILWKWKGFKKLKSQEHQAESSSQGSMKFVLCVNAIRAVILSYFRPNFQKQAGRKGKVNYFSIVNCMGTKISISLEERVGFRTLEL